MFKELNPTLYSWLRLAIVSILLTMGGAEFAYLKEKTQSTAGNLGVQLDELGEAGYIKMEKNFAGKGPRTACRVAAGGRKTMKEYVETLKEYLSGLQFMPRIELSDDFAFSLFSSTFVPRNKQKDV